MAGPTKKEPKKASRVSSPSRSKAGYFFGSLKKLALFPFAAGAKAAQGWDPQADSFHQRSDITFT
jgi:hypothetical protein